MATRVPGLVLALALAAAAAAAAIAQDPAAKPAQDPVANPPQDPAAESCTFDVREQPVDRVLRFVREASGHGIPVADGLKDARISLKVKALPWRAALAEIAERCGGEVVEEAGEPRLDMGSPARKERARLLALPPIGTLWLPKDAGPGTVSFALREIPLGTAVAEVARASWNAIGVVPEIADRRVSLEVKDVPWQQALQSLAAAADVTVWEERPKVLRVGPRLPDPIARLHFEVRSCSLLPAAVAEAEAIRDFLRLARARKKLRTCVADIESAIAALPDEVRRGELRDLLWRAVEAPFEEFRRKYADLLQDK